MENLKKVLIDLQCEMVAERTLSNPENISWLQYDILILLEKQENRLPSDLSIQLGISRTKLSKNLKKLKTLDYIQQSPNLSDGRELYTSLTSRGKELLTTISDRHGLLFQTATKALTEDEQKQLTYLASKFSDALRKERILNHE